MRLILKAVFVAIVLAVTLPVRGSGYIEDRADGTTVIHVSVFELPDPTFTDAYTRSEAAGVRVFRKNFPKIFAERYRDKYKADPAKYGKHNWDKVQIELTPFVGISAGIEADTMAISGGVPPDVLYVNFRKSDYFIQNQFLYPLDKPEDGYVASMTKEELDYRVHPKIWPVIRRKGHDGVVHTWALPYGGALGTVLLYRKDLFDAKGVPYPTADWDWNDMIEACRKIADPAKGIYGLIGGSGDTESWFWFNYLWAAGGEVMVQDPATEKWKYVFDSPEAAESLDFYLRLNNEKWTDANGKIQRGYVLRSTYGLDAWNRGEVAMDMSYIDGKLFSTINPQLTGMVPTPKSYSGNRGSELNSKMMGISALTRSPVVRDAAWEYIRYYDSFEARAIKTKIMVEGGFGPFLNPDDLDRYGYPEIKRLAPKGWGDIFNIAINSGHPEPYGPNASYIYQITSPPMHVAEELYLKNALPTEHDARIKELQKILHVGVDRANEEYLGIVDPAQRALRDRVAWAALTLIGLVFAFAGYRIIKSFSPPADLAPVKERKRRYGWAYLLLVPALLTIVIWQYYPLARGSVMAFQDYKLQGDSTWVGVKNFGDLLFDDIWWGSVWNAIRYSFLIMALTFIPPIVLAILLQEVPRGSLLFRIIFYMPGVLSGLVTILLWKQFYAPSQTGVLNEVVMHIPAIGYLALGVVMLIVAIVFAQRLFQHNSNATAISFIVVGLLVLGACIQWAWPVFNPPGQMFFTGKVGASVANLGHNLFSGASHPMSMPMIGHDIAEVFKGLGRNFHGLWSHLVSFPAEPYRWLSDPETAMLACVIPMVWAGIGPGCLIYLAALKGIPEDYYEAADIDGASFVDKILFVVFPILKPLILINFIGVFIGSWYGAEANILAMTGGSGNTEVAGLHIFYKAFRGMKFGPATAMAWVLAFMLIGLTVYQLRIISRVEFKAAGSKV